MPVGGVRGEVDLARPIGLAPPHQRAAAQMIAANPRKRATFGRGIGILAIVDPPMLGRGVERVATALDVVLARDLILVDAAPVLVLPRALHVGIIGAVLDMAATQDRKSVVTGKSGSI